MGLDTGTSLLELSPVTRCFSPEIKQFFRSCCFHWKIKSLVKSYWFFGESNHCLCTLHFKKCPLCSHLCLSPQVSARALQPERIWSCCYFNLMIIKQNASWPQTAAHLPGIIHTGTRLVTQRAHICSFRFWNKQLCWDIWISTRDGRRADLVLCFAFHNFDYFIL